MKTVEHVILKGEAEEEYKRLNETAGEERKNGIINSENQQLLNSIKRTVELIKENPMYGSPISKKLIAKTKLPVNNLFVCKLTGYWRMLYTIVGDRVEIICYVLEICDHKKYDRLFGYRKK